MTTPTDDEPEHPRVTAVLHEAQRVVKQVATVLQAAGWDAVIISVSRAVEWAPGEWQAPGATATIIDKPRCGPVIAQLAEVMRKQAAVLDQNAVAEEASTGYIHDQTDYASGMAEWPK